MSIPPLAESHARPHASASPSDIHSSELLDLGGLYERIAVGNLGLSMALVIELTLMALCIAMLPTVAVPTTALEASETQLLLARTDVAPVAERNRTVRLED